MTFSPSELALLATGDRAEDVRNRRGYGKKKPRKMVSLGRLTLSEALVCQRAGYSRRDLMAAAGVCEWRVAQWRRDNGLARACRRRAHA